MKIKKVGGSKKNKNMKNFVGFIVLATGLVLGGIAVVNINNGGIPIFWGLLCVGCVLVFGGYKIMSS